MTVDDIRFWYVCASCCSECGIWNVYLYIWSVTFVFPCCAELELLPLLPTPFYGKPNFYVLLVKLASFYDNYHYVKVLLQILQYMNTVTCVLISSSAGALSLVEVVFFMVVLIIAYCSNMHNIGLHTLLPVPLLTLNIVLSFALNFVLKFALNFS